MYGRAKKKPSSGGPSPLSWFAFAVALAAAAIAVLALVLGDSSERGRSDSYTHTLTFDKTYWDPINLFRTSLNEPFNASVRIWTDDDRLLVYLSFPALQFVVQSDGVPVTGYLYTVPGTNLPQRLWPRNLIGSADSAPCISINNSVCYSYWIGPDGSVTLKSAQGGPLPALADGQRVPPTTVVYSLPESVVCTPANVRLSQGSSNVVGSTQSVHHQDYLDYRASDSAYDDDTGLVRFAFVWSDNSDQANLSPRNRLNVAFRRADVDPVSGAVTWGPLVLALPAPANVNYAEMKVAIDPNDVDHIAIHVIRRDWNVPYAHVGNLNTVVSVSFDGGATWSDPIAPWDPALFTADPWLLIDNFGNCYASAIANLAPNDYYGAGAHSVRLSTDGCRTFPAEIASVQPVDAADGGFIDFPKIAYGPDGSGIDGQYALWLSGDDARFDVGTVVPTISFVPITGLGSYGTLTSLNAFDQIPTGACGIGLSQIYVNPNTGAVYFFSTNSCDYSGEGNTLGDDLQLSMWVNPTGTVGYGPSSFLPRRVVQISNYGIKAGHPFTNYALPWAPVRGGPMFAVGEWGYDANLDRMYFLAPDERPANSSRTYALLVYSDNEGQTWSDAVVINNDHSAVIGHLALSVEPRTGVAAASWFDPRNNQPAQQSVDAYAAILRPSDLNQLCSP